MNGDTREKGGQPFKFTLYNLKTDAWDRAVQVVQSQLKDIGVQMEIQDFEFGTLLQKAQAGEHQMEMMGYTYPNPGHRLSLVRLRQHRHRAQSEPRQRSESRRADRQVAGDDGRAARDQVYQDLQKYLVDQAVWVPLWIDTYTEAYDKSIQGAKFHPDGYTVYFDAFLS